MYYNEIKIDEIPRLFVKKKNVPTLFVSKLWQFEIR